jgi:hypothetical protein
MGLATACTAGGDRAFTEPLHFERFYRDDASLACITGRTDEHHKAVLDRFIDHPESSP